LYHAGAGEQPPNWALQGASLVNHERASAERWYEGITGYQWLVLAVASLGWVFDVFEGQIFVASMNEAMPALLPGTSQGELAYYNNLTFAAFLVGGALGGVLFGMVADRIGRKRALTWTILTYSACTCLSALAQAWWHMAAFRFLVALGVGGEWAVASALVAEVFPRRARAWSQSLFHASSVLGTLMAVAAGTFLVANQALALPLPLPGGIREVAGWRVGFALGAVPAVLIVWVRASLREPEVWLKARAGAIESGAAFGRAVALFAPALRRRTLVGVGLATVGLSTFWGVHIYGKDVLRRAYQARYLATLPSDASPENREALLAMHAPAIKRGEMLGMFLVTVGGGLGLVSFGPLADRLGRRGAFLLFQLGGLTAALVLFNLLKGVAVLCAFLPLFGFLTLGMHAGYAVYFPELFPTRLRGTGGGFCFNVGRLLAAPVLFLGGWLQRDAGLSLAGAASALSLLFLPGAVLLLFAPETRGHELPG
jgi:MFS family permease